MKHSTPARILSIASVSPVTVATQHLLADLANLRKRAQRPLPASVITNPSPSARTDYLTQLNRELANVSKRNIFVD